MRLVALSLLCAVTVYGQGSSTPLYNAVLQSDLNAAGFKILSSNMADYAGTGMTWNVVTGKFDVSGGGGGGSGTVTSITGSGVIVATPNPITSTGDIDLDPTFTSLWNTAYTDRLKWDGGATGLTAATGRTSLGLVIGTNVEAYLGNPSVNGYVLSSTTGGVRSWIAPAAGGGTPGGSTTQVQFNDGGAFGGDADFTWDKTGKKLYFGSALDVNLYRNSALTLRTDAQFWAAYDIVGRYAGGDQCRVGNTGGGKGGLLLGSAEDTKIYRDSAGVLKTDGQMVIGGLTTNGFVKTTSGTGALSVDTATYQPADADLTTFAGITPTTVGQSFLTLANPSAITFPEISATNVVSAKTAAQLKTDLSLTATDVGLGNVTNNAQLVTAGDLSPLFTTTETTGNVAFSLSTAAANTVFGNATASTAAPTFSSSPRFTAIGNLTTNGFVKTGGGVGTLSVDTATYLTANQSISLTGDVTGGPAATSIATTIGANKVTLGMMATMSTDSILGRKTAATGNVEELTALPFAYTGDVTRPVDSNVTTLAAGNAGNLNSGTLLAARMPAFTGDVTSSAGTTANVIANNAVTYGKMQAVSAVDKLLGSSHTTTPVQEITLGTNLSMSGTTLNATGGGGTTFIGLTDVPASYSGAGGKLVAVNSGATALEFISAAGGGNVSNSGTPTAGQYGRWVTATTIEGVAASTVRTDLGLVIGTNVQAWDTDLDVWATKTPYAGTLTITTGKTFNVTNNLTLSGTDGSTLNVGGGGTLGTAAYTATGAYEVPLTFSTGLTRSTNTVTVNTSQNIAKLSNLTTNGFVKTGSSDGTLSVDTATYQAADADLTTWAGITPVAAVGTWIATPSSANLRAAVTDENGTGALLFSGATTPDFTTGFTIGAAAASGKILVGNGTNYVPSTPTFPATASATSRKFIVSDGTNWVASTETQAVPGTSGNVLTSDGTNWLSSAPVVTTSNTATLTNKRITPRVTTITSNATLSPSADNDDIYAVSALAVAITTISAPTGTPVDGQKLIIRVISDSTIRAISGWNAIYQFSSALTAPSTTVASSTHTWGFMYNSTTAKWQNIAQATNP